MGKKKSPFKLKKWNFCFDLEKKKGLGYGKTLFSEIKGFLSAQMDFEKKNQRISKKTNGFQKKVHKKRIFLHNFDLIFFSKSKVTFLVALLFSARKKGLFPFSCIFCGRKGIFSLFSTENVRERGCLFFSCTFLERKNLFSFAKK
jgi:hypothetical protein